MGGSGGVFSGGRPPSEVAKMLLKASSTEEQAEFDAKLSAELSKLLTGFNQRDTQLVQQRLEQIRNVLGDRIDGTVDTLFGGSVSKHTYVDGISDIDSLLLVSGTALEKLTPAEILNRVARYLKKGLGESADVSVGSVAVTVTYADKTEIQLVPALKHEEAYRVPDWNTNAWSKIDPKQFSDGLSKRNAECGGKVIPTVKLVKALNATLPEEMRLSGYHIESLAVVAFRGYGGEKHPSKMLSHFFDQARTLVLKPMVDRTGQSVHVDEYLGPAGSPERAALSHVMDRIARRMVSASAARSLDRWLSLFGEI